MKRAYLYGGALVAASVMGTLVFPNLASTQSLPPASTVRIVETTYAAAGTSALGTTGSVAWFIETNSDKERRPIACITVSGTVECKRGAFPQP